MVASCVFCLVTAKVFLNVCEPTLMPQEWVGISTKNNFKKMFDPTNTGSSLTDNFVGHLQNLQDYL